MNEAFKSNAWRLTRIKAIRQGVSVFFRGVSFQVNCPYLNCTFDETSVLDEEVKVKRIYFRDTTDTSVYKLRNSEGSVILKIYLITDPDRAAHNIEIRSLRIFSKFVIDGIIPHFILPICRSFILGSVAAKLFPSDHWKVDKQYQLMMSEAADCSLTDLVFHQKLSPCDLQMILFQVFFTLRFIQTQYPKFRHNDLHCSNILIQRVHALPLKYKIDGVSYYIKTPFRVLFWDMYFSTGLENIQNNNLNEFYTYPDVHKCLDSLIFLFKKNSDKAYRQTHANVLAFLNQVVPKKLQCHIKDIRGVEKQKLLKKHITHLNMFGVCQVLELPFFANLRIPMSVSRSYGHVVRLKSKEKKEVLN